MTPKFAIRVLAGEAPIKSPALGIAALLPGGDLARHGGPVRQPALQALPVGAGVANWRHGLPVPEVPLRPGIGRADMLFV